MIQRFDSGNVCLYEGDSLEILRKLKDNFFDLVLADPPYGIDYQGNRRQDKDTLLPKIANDGKPFIWWLYDAYRVTKDGGAILCFCRWDVQELWRLAIEAAGYTVKSQVIWNREHHGSGDLKAQFAPQHDVIWFGIKGKFAFCDTRPKSVVSEMRVSSHAIVHPNEKPVGLMQQLIKPCCPEGGMVLDPFAGVCPTGEAALELGRGAILIEKSADYCTIGAQRMTHRLAAMQIKALDSEHRS